MPDFTREEIIAKVSAGENMRGANLSGADLRYADLRAAELNGAFHTADTKWPEDFHPEAAGAVLKEDDD